MAIWLRQSTATTVQLGPFVEVTDGYSYKATTITIVSGVLKYVFPNAAVVNSTGAGVLADPGWMTVPISVSDTAAAGALTLRIGNATNNLPVWRSYMIVPAQVYDSYILGTDNIQVDVVQITGAAPSAATVNANIIAINNAAPTTITFNANVLTITGAAPSAAVPNFLLDYVMFTPGAQSITVKDTLKVIAAGVAGKLDGATGAAVRLYGPSGNIRVSAAVVSGNRTGVTWVTG